MIIFCSKTYRYQKFLKVGLGGLVWTSSTPPPVRIGLEYVVQSANPFNSARPAPLRVFHKKNLSFKFDRGSAPHSSSFLEEKISSLEFNGRKLSDIQFKFTNQKKNFEWVCYSQSQYPRFGLDAVQTHPNGGFRGASPLSTTPLEIEKPLVDSFQLFNLNKNLFERQNILRCYKERNLLRLIIAFFDSANNTEAFLDWTKPTRLFGRIPSLKPLGSVGMDRFGMDTSKPFQTKLFPYGHFQFFEIFGRSLVSIKKGLIKTRLNVLSKTPASFILVQILIIPYTFLFGIFYTCGYFQISSTLTAQNFATLANYLSLVPLENLYSYSIQFHALPYEFLRLSHFSSKLFLLWGFLTIWKGVRPAKSTRNEYIIQTRLLTPGKNKKRFHDVEGVEKFLPILKTLLIMDTIIKI